MKDFAITLREVCERPALYVGHTSIRAVRHYLQGYCDALRNAGYSPPQLIGWQRWIEKRFLIQHPAWHWSRILVHEYGSDEAAIRAMLELYPEFERQYDEIGIAGIEAELEQELTKRYGDILASDRWPESSLTGDDWFSDPPYRR